MKKKKPTEYKKVKSAKIADSNKGCLSIEFKDGDKTYIALPPSNNLCTFSAAVCLLTPALAYNS